MSDINIFEYAAKKKMRFPYKGIISVEDLFDLKVEELDKIYKSLNARAKERDEESLINVKTDNDKDLDVAIDIIKHIVAEKLEDVKREKIKRENKERKQKLLAILAEKDDDELKNKSADEIRKMIDELE